MALLRSFHDDQIGLRSKKIVNVFQRVLTRGSLFSNIDELLTERFWHVGPVFAIGKPDEPLPPLGAARAYLSGEDWHTVVSELMKEARAIILVLDYTEGLLWELHHAREAGHLGKTVLLVPPDHRADTQLLAGVLSVLGADNEKIDSAAAQSAIALLPVSTGCIAALYGNCVDSYAYDLSLRLGLHAILGDRELPGELQSIFVPASLTNLTKESRMGA